MAIERREVGAVTVLEDTELGASTVIDLTTDPKEAVFRVGSGKVKMSQLGLERLIALLGAALRVMAPEAVKAILEQRGAAKGAHDASVGGEHGGKARE